jgi:hypothetical protein
MAYPSTFHRVVVIGNLYTEKFNWSFNIIPKEVRIMGAEPVTQAWCSQIATLIGDWWRDTSPLGTPIGGFTSAGITSVKVNRIGTDGKYSDDVTREHIFGSPQSGNTAGQPPAQLATAVTLRTSVERGRASKGRFYLPVLSGWVALGTDGRATAAAAGIAASATVRLLNSVNDLYDVLPSTDTSRMRVGVASDIGSGTFREATRVEVGRVPDTMRSRRSSLAEDHQGANLSA